MKVQNLYTPYKNIPIFKVILQDLKYNDDNLYNIIRKLASTYTDAGFPGEDGFGSNHKSNKIIDEITKEIEKLKKYFNEKI